jgi:large subunit ribosomal protein L25
MEKMLELKAEIRTKTGSISAAKERKKGKVPVVLYGHKEETLSLVCNTHDLVEGIHHGARVFEVDVDGKKNTAIIKGIQYDHLGIEVLHVDLMRVDAAEKITVSVSLDLKGIAKGATEGGILEKHMNSVEVECKVFDIPQSIVVSVKELGIGDSILAKDIKLPAGVTLVTDPEALIVACNIVVEAPTTEELESETPMQPEIITERKPTDEDGAEADKK